MRIREHEPSFEEAPRHDSAALQHEFGFGAQEQRAFDLLTKHRRGLDLIAEALLEHETIDGPTVAGLIQQGMTESGEFDTVHMNVAGTPD